MSAEAIDLFGEVHTPGLDMNKLRTKAGALSSATLKAIKWYTLEHGLKLTASSAMPIMTCINSDGDEQTVNVEDVITEYKQFKRRTHGRKRAA
ncbi:hypothetical protein [Arthrobacter sp. EpRS71]|uniref:hypothetical protein n=1 Tax=Arthrobacter sp. EpRS71 TaxID=1743141 RepID=UPI00074A1D70|nr:hypothetical protein [Arthrobacter sp. EpRS71]KUM38989.1 hypothetical protein AR689_07495 [Arthrobacter sp. EpRS71]